MSTALPLCLVLFIGMAAAMVVPPVRRSVPRWFEALVWLGLAVAGWLTATNVQGANASNLTGTLAWGAGQLVNVSIRLLMANVTPWLAGHKYGIANAIVLLVLLDIFWLAMLRSRRQGYRSLPRIMLGEWFELPLHKPWGPPAVAGVREHWPATLGSPRQAAIQVHLVPHIPSIAPPAESGNEGLMTGDELIDIRTFLSDQSIGWYGAIAQGPASTPTLHEDAAEDESSRLAS